MTTNSQHTIPSTGWVLPLVAGGHVLDQDGSVLLFDSEANATKMEGWINDNHPTFPARSLPSIKTANQLRALGVGFNFHFSLRCKVKKKKRCKVKKKNGDKCGKQVYGGGICQECTARRTLKKEGRWCDSCKAEKWGTNCYCEPQCSRYGCGGFVHWHKNTQQHKRGNHYYCPDCKSYGIPS